MDEKDVKRLAIAGGIGLFVFWVLNSAYNAGLSAGLASDGDGGYGARHGFFPFPPFLLIVGIIALVLYFRSRAGGGRGPANGGQRRGGPPRFFEDWHRQAHQDDDSQPPAPVETPPSGGPDQPTKTSML